MAVFCLCFASIDAGSFEDSYLLLTGMTRGAGEDDISNGAAMSEHNGSESPTHGEIRDPVYWIQPAVMTY